jgi:hypothetical protein
MLRVDKQKEKEELDRMKKRNSVLQRDASELPSKLEQHKHRDEEQQRRTSAMQQVIQKRERAQKMEVEERKSELDAYQRALGLTIRKDSSGNTHFRFTHVDSSDLEAQFSFVVRVADENDSSLSLVSCIPPLESASSIIESYNRSQHQGKFSTLVRIFRREFKATLASNRH